MQWLTKNLLDSFKYCKKKKKNSNSDIKISEKPKNIKESNDSQLRNYWNRTKYIWLNNREIWVTFERIISIIASFFIL